MITQSSIQDVKDLAIEQVIGKFIELKKAGSNYKAKSPFTDERTASFMVSPVKQIFKCYSSGHGGDGIKFVMLHQGLTFPEAVKLIAQNHGIHLEHEQLTEEEIKTHKQRDRYKETAEHAAREYAMALSKLPQDHWARAILKKRGITQDEIIERQLGFAPGNLLHSQYLKMGRLAEAKDIGLVRTKDNRNYDFFYDRILFPIHDNQGRAIAFGGRKSNLEKDADSPKYINSPDSSIYNKSRTLYGMHLAQRHMAKSKLAVLVEGYTDVITLHRYEMNQTVATCGTALTEQHAKAIGRLVNEIVIFRDGDAAGLRAVEKDLNILLGTGKKVSVLICPEGEDPDSLAQKMNNPKTLRSFLCDQKVDGVLWRAQRLWEASGEDPMQQAGAVDDISETLMCIKHEVARNNYIKAVAPMMKTTARIIKGNIKEKESALHAKAVKTNASIDSDLLNGLPQGADINEYLEKGFLTVGNNFWVKDDKWKKACNFRMRPLFHVEGNKDTVRIFDVVNEVGAKSLVELESNVILNKNQNQSRLLDYDYYMWDVSLKDNQFKMIMARLTKECIKVKPFDYFGWQSKGFWAYANGVFHDGEFSEVNQYGIISVEGLEEIDSDYYNNTPNFYSPAYNVTNRFKEDNQDLYKNDRDYVYKESPIDFNTWMGLFSKVYPHLANVGIAFVIATCFRDFIGSRYDAFPHLFFTGEKESGKTTAAKSLASVFTYNQKALDLNTSTMVGFSRRLERGKNTISVLEEFNDTTTDLKMKQAMKGAYDFRGREIGMMTNDTRTKSSNVYCSLIILSQFLSSWDDNSLTSRSSTHHFVKHEKFTDAQIADYTQLKEYEEKGLTSLVLEIVHHRGLIEQNFHKAFGENSRKFKKALVQDYKDRVLMNFNILYTPVSILAQKFNYPFDLDAFFDECCEKIIENTDLITSTEGIAEFWSAVQELFNMDKLREGVHYDLDQPTSITFLKGKGNAQKWKNDRNDRILFLKFNDIHGMYLDVVSRREGVDAIGKQTLVNYFKGKKYFVGLVQSRRWTVKDESGKVLQSNTTSGYAFNYTMLRQLLNLEKDDRTAEEKQAEANEDNPFIPEEGANQQSMDGLFETEEK